MGDQNENTEKLQKKPEQRKEVFYVKKCFNLKLK